MSKFALKTTLPGYLREEQERVEKVARGYGLDFFPTVFEMLTYDQMNEVAAYGGFPNRYPHWRFGMEYEQLSKSYEYGLSKIYEMVINNNPSYAYLLEGNSLTEQKLVMAHVLGHVDFFKNNFAFRTTDLDAAGRLSDPMRRAEPFNPQRKWIDKMANNGGRIRRHMDRFGVSKIEEFVDFCLSLENLIDPWRPFTPTQTKDETPEDAPPKEVPRLRAKNYMEKYINPEEYMEEQRRKITAEAERERRFPESPQRDVLLFLIENAPLERWERDVVEVIREEAYYFVPQMQTKIMNEGWACVAPATLVFTDGGVLTMKALVEGSASAVSDGERTRAVYDRNIIAKKRTVRVRTRRGLSLEGSHNHRVLLADGATWKRLDELAVGERVAVSGGQGLWAKHEAQLRWPGAPRLTVSGAAEAAEEAGGSVDTARIPRAGGVGRGGAQALAPGLERLEARAPAVEPLARRRAATIPRTVTRELGALLGYLVGAGHIRRSGHQLGLTTGGDQQASAFVGLVQRLFGVAASMTRGEGAWRVLVHSETVSDVLACALGLTGGARAERVPDAVLRSPEPVVRDFLRAYFDCGGEVGEQGVTLGTTSDTLAEQVQLLLLNFGVLSRREGDGGARVHVSGPSARLFAARVGFGLARKSEALEGYLLDGRWSTEEAWDDEIVSLEGGEGDVYDISVEETHRYAAAGFINHNSYWHSRMMTEKIADATEILDYADRNASVMATSKGQLNPYKLGVELYRNVEERWNKGQFGREWEECDDVASKRNWDLRLGIGREKIFEVRRLYTDVTFLDEFLTVDVARDLKLFTFAYSGRSERFEIESREFKKVKDKLLFQLTNAGSPVINVIDANHENRGELLLRHEHVGLDLRVDYAKETLKALFRLWRRPVSVATVLDSKPSLLRFDGVEHTSRPYKL